MMTGFGGGERGCELNGEPRADSRPRNNSALFDVIGGIAVNGVFLNSMELLSEAMKEGDGVEKIRF